MFTTTKIQSDIKPNKFESLNNGVWYYNHDIQSEVIQTLNDQEELVDKTVYTFVQVRILGKPTYEKCVKAIIRAYVDANDEFDLINSYNSYQLDIDDLDNQYEEFLSLVSIIKYKVAEDFQVSNEKIARNTPKLADVMKLMVMAINTFDLTDELALSVKSLYPLWESFIGTTLKIGTKIQYGAKLFKVVLEHLVLEQFPPSVNTAAMYTEIVEDHSGTIDDPIPYPEDGNMIIYKDKYYIEEGIIYRCTRNSEFPLYAKLKTLVGNYVEEVVTLD